MNTDGALQVEESKRETLQLESKLKTDETLSAEDRKSENRRVENKEKHEQMMLQLEFQRDTQVKAAVAQQIGD